MLRLPHNKELQYKLQKQPHATLQHDGTGHSKPMFNPLKIKINNPVILESRTTNSKKQYLK
jgi:hypothetical protein